MPPERLEATLANGAPVPNTWIRSAEGSDSLAFMLPGRGYTVLGPVLHYPRALAIQHGYDALSVDYQFGDEMPPGDVFAHAFACAEAVWRTFAAQRKYDRLILIGKSLGTQAMAWLLDAEPAVRSARCVWLTPIFADDRLMDAIERHKPASLFVTGSADPTYMPDRMRTAVETTNGQELLIEGTNHGLEHPADVRASLAVVPQLLDAVERFITTN